ncbi:MAG: YoaK family protein [Gammaproteobacteria bacterium]|jgi:uncharacterized membrane protein YoaK (UPF0700 family)
MPYAPLPEQGPSGPDEAATPLLFLVAALLAGLAGYVNAVMLSYAGMPVSHMSGPATELGIDLGRFNPQNFLLLAGIMVGFMLGAMFSGLMVASTVLRPGRRYGVALLIEGLLLSVAAVFAVSAHPHLALVAAAMACGLQNALAASYRGLTLRTTHVTGIVTDIGVLLAHRLRHKRIKTWKLMLLVVILAGFIVGGIAGVVMFLNWGAHALSFAAGFCLLIAIGYLPREENAG